MTSRGSADERLTLEGLKLSVLRSAVDMIKMFVRKLGYDDNVESVEL